MQNATFIHGGEFFSPGLASAWPQQQILMSMYLLVLYLQIPPTESLLVANS
jgi:hypothetical protein